MTRLRTAAPRLALRDTTSSTSVGFGSVAPRPHSYAPVPCFILVSHLSGRFRDCALSMNLKELQCEWERDPSSAGHWIDAVAGVGSSADHWVVAVAGSSTLAGIPGQIPQEDIQLPLLIRAYQIRGRVLHMAGLFGLEDRPFPDRCYRRNRSALERELVHIVSAMSGLHFEKLL